MSTFIDKFFDLENNDTVPGFVGGQDKIFRNREYQISFPHDNMSNIKEKYTRRFTRMKEHFYNDKFIIIVYASRWTKHDDILYKMLEDLVKIRKDITLVSINALEDKKSPANVIVSNIPFPEYVISNIKNLDDWSYDTIYNQNLKIELKSIFQSILEYTI